MFYKGFKIDKIINDGNGLQLSEYRIERVKWTKEEKGIKDYLIINKSFENVEQAKEYIDKY
jgi:hypothetical protein